MDGRPSVCGENRRGNHLPFFLSKFLSNVQETCKTLIFAAEKFWTQTHAFFLKMGRKVRRCVFSGLPNDAKQFTKMLNLQSGAATVNYSKCFRPVKRCVGSIPTCSVRSTPALFGAGVLRKDRLFITVKLPFLQAQCAPTQAGWLPCRHCCMASSRIRAFTAIFSGQQAVQAPHSMQSSGPADAGSSFITGSPFSSYRLLAWMTAGMSMPAGHTALHLPQFVQACFAPAAVWIVFKCLFIF